MHKMFILLIIKNLEEAKRKLQNCVDVILHFIGTTNKNKMARLVQNVEEVKNIFQELNGSSDDYTLPVRGMLQFILAGKLPTGKLYINGDRSAVAVLHELSEYSSLDGDILTIYVKDIDLFVPFFTQLSEERNWNSGHRILYFHYIRDDLVEQTKSILTKLNCDDLGSFRLQYPVQHDDITMTLPTGFRIAVGKREDAKQISSTWNYNAPDKVKMIEWLLDQFPSFTIRDIEDKLVAWVLTYSCGASGALYVLPEFRRRHFGRTLISEAVHQHARLLPCPRYGGVSLKNRLSLAFSTSNKPIITNVCASWLLFRFQNSVSKI